MWFPMIVGQNEKQFTWMDEGLTSYNTNVGTNAFYPEGVPVFGTGSPRVDAWDRRRQYHYFIAGTSLPRPPMRHADRYPLADGNIARFIASYSTPAVMLHALEGIVGEAQFLEAYREYARRWAFKHPYPYDFFNTMEASLGQDLDWLWTPMLYETWAMDHGIADIRESPGGITVTIRDEGLAPMPAIVEAVYTDGTKRQARVPVQTWLGGAREATVTFPPGELLGVQLDPGSYLPDVNAENDQRAAGIEEPDVKMDE